METSAMKVSLEQYIQQEVITIEFNLLVNT